MKRVLLFLSAILLCTVSEAQLYINGDLTIQNGVTLYADDTVKLGASAAITSEGVLQSTKAINTNGTLINTGSAGFIISPVAPGSAKAFDIGTTTNNRIQLQHSSAGPVNFKLAVRNNVYQNPQTNTGMMTTMVVGKTWHVEPLSAVTSNTATLFWNTSDELSSFNRGTSGTGRWQSGVTTAWSFMNGTSAATSTGSTPAWSRTSPAGNLAAGVYYYGIGGQGSLMPVKLLSFEANEHKGDAWLNWRTASEFNSAYFEIERALTAKGPWEKAGSLDAQGNSFNEHIYFYNDEAAFAKTASNILYYRLRQVDGDGSHVYSDTRRVELNGNNLYDISVFPNPARQELHIRADFDEAADIKIELYDIQGKMVLNHLAAATKGINTFPLYIAHLNEGVYFIQVSPESKSPFIQKIVIE